jgi:hypothetical protein
MAARRRDAKTYARRKPAKEPYDVVLIVCEGKKTEPFYFSRLRAIHRLSSANIEILTADGTDPMSIILFAEEKVASGIYDKVFCVFDRNGHANYQAALRRVANSPSGKAGRLIPIPSWPCFEVWLLLHFSYSSSAFEKAGNRSSCEKVISALKVHLPAYQKGHRTIYDDLLPKQVMAIRHAARLHNENLRTKSQNPATRVYDLVTYLLKLRPS